MAERTAKRRHEESKRATSSLEVTGTCPSDISSGLGPSSSGCGSEPCKRGKDEDWKWERFLVAERQFFRARDRLRHAQQLVSQSTSMASLPDVYSDASSDTNYPCTSVSAKSDLDSFWVNR